MKKIILLLVLLVSIGSYAQNDNSSTSKNQEEKFKYDSSGLSPKNISISIEGMDKEALLSKAKDWVREKYGDSDDVFRKDDEADDESNLTDKAKTEKIRFEGYTNNAICFGNDSEFSCEDLKYIILIKIKDGEYTFKPVKLTYKIGSSKKDQVVKFKGSDFYIKNGGIKSEYEKVPAQIETLFNDLSKSLLNYLTDKEQEKEW